MKALWKLYKRYFRLHRRVLGITVVVMVISAAEPYAFQGLMAFVVDDVLEVRLRDQQGVVDQGDQPSWWKRRGQGQDGAAMELPAKAHRRESLQDQLARKVGKSTAEKYRLLLWVVLTVAGMRLYFLLSGMWAKFRTQVMTQKAVFRIRTHLFEKLQRLQLQYHDQRQTGKLMSRVMDDVRAIQNTFAGLLTMVAAQVGSLLIGIGVALWINPTLAVMAFSVLPFYALVFILLRRPIRDNARAVRSINASIYGLARDRLSSPRVVKAFHQERRESIRFFRRNKKMLRMQHRKVLLARLMWGGAGLISVVGTTVVLGAGARMVRDGLPAEDPMTLGKLLFFYGAVTMLFSPITTLSSLVSEVTWIRVVIDRVLDILDEPVAIQDRPGVLELPQIEGHIRFEGVSLRYGESARDAVRGLSVEIPAGMKVCVMGPSGAGKSTLASLLLRLYEPTEGRITIDGVALSQVKLSSLRQHVAYVPQEPILFSGTIARNIRYGRSDAADDQVIAAAEAAEVHGFIETLPDRYESEVGERGVTLSGGQKQRISLARALLTDPKILVLDDCTSALDAHTEARIQRTLRFALADRTALIITHRVSMSRKADLILVLDNGELVEQGTHEELLERGGVYWNLIADQLSVEERESIERRAVSVA